MAQTCLHYRAISPVGAMFAFVIMYGSCMPQEWIDERLRVVMFLQGDFTIADFAESLASMVSCQNYDVDISSGSLHTWTWTGPAT